MDTGRKIGARIIAQAPDGADDGAEYFFVRILSVWLRLACHNRTSLATQPDHSATIQPDSTALTP